MLWLSISQAQLQRCCLMHSPLSKACQHKAFLWVISVKILVGVIQAWKVSFSKIIIASFHSSRFTRKALDIVAGSFNIYYSNDCSLAILSFRNVQIIGRNSLVTNTENENKLQIFRTKGTYIFDGAVQHRKQKHIMNFNVFTRQRIPFIKGSNIENCKDRMQSSKLLKIRCVCTEIFVLIHMASILTLMKLLRSSRPHYCKCSLYGI